MTPNNDDDGVPNSDDEVLNSDDEAPNSDDGVPNCDDEVPNSDDGVPNSDDGVPNSDDGVLNCDDEVPNSDDGVPNSDDGVPNSDDEAPNLNGEALRDCLKRDRRLGCGQGRPKPSNNLRLFMDSGLLMITAGSTKHFGVRRQPYSSSYRNPGCPTSPPELALVHCLAAALDFTWRRIGSRHRCCSQRKAPSPRRVGNLNPRFPASAVGIPIAGVPFDRAALPAHSKTILPWVMADAAARRLGYGQGRPNPAHGIADRKSWVSFLNPAYDLLIENAP